MSARWIVSSWLSLLFRHYSIWSFVNLLSVYFSLHFCELELVYSEGLGFIFS